MSKVIVVCLCSASQPNHLDWKHTGHRCIWLSWVSHSFSTFRERLSCQSVSIVIRVVSTTCWTSIFSLARGRKAEALRAVYADSSSIEVVEISDIVHGQFQDALVGADAVIHTASPLPSRADPQKMLNVRSLFTANNLKLIDWLFYLVDCHRRFSECFTTSRESRS